MAVRQYIGARYVPKFWDNGSGSTEWVPNIPYESLVVVTYMNNSYTSKVPVPATQIAPNVDTEHWALTGAYNAQVEQYRQEVEKVKKNGYVTPDDFGAVADGVTDDTNAFVNAFANANKILIPSGKVYTIQGELSIRSGTELLVNGTIKATRELGFSLSLFDGVTPTPEYTGVHDVIIHGTGTLDCNSAGHPEFTRTPIRIHHCQNITVSDITIKNYSKYHAIEIGGSKFVTIDGVKFKGMLTNDNIGGTYEAIQIEEISEGGAYPAIPYDGTLSKNITIKNCYFSGSDEGGKMYRCICTHSALNDETKTKMFENIVIENNFFDNITKYPADLNLLVDPNMFMICLDSNWKNAKIVGNTFNNIGGSCIFVGKYSENIDIFNNNMIDVYGTPISEETNCENIFISNNKILSYGKHNSVINNKSFCPAVYAASTNSLIVDNNFIQSTFANIGVHLVGSTEQTTGANIRNNTLNIEYSEADYVVNKKISSESLLAFPSGKGLGEIELSKDITEFDRIVLMIKFNNYWYDEIITPNMIGMTVVTSKFDDGKQYTMRLAISKTSINIIDNYRYNSSGEATRTDGTNDFMSIYKIFGYKSWDNII